MKKRRGREFRRGICGLCFWPRSGARGGSRNYRFLFGLFHGQHRLRFFRDDGLFLNRLFFFRLRLFGRFSRCPAFRKPGYEPQTGLQDFAGPCEGEFRGEEERHQESGHEHDYRARRVERGFERVCKKGPDQSACGYVSSHERERRRDRERCRQREHHQDHSRNSNAEISHRP